MVGKRVIYNFSEGNSLFGCLIFSLMLKKVEVTQDHYEFDVSVHQIESEECKINSLGGIYRGCERVMIASP